MWRPASRLSAFAKQAAEAIAINLGIEVIVSLSPYRRVLEDLELLVRSLRKRDFRYAAKQMTLVAMIISRLAFLPHRTSSCPQTTPTTESVVAVLMIFYYRQLATYCIKKPHSHLGFSP